MNRYFEIGWVAGLWQYRELLYFFAWRDVKIRYKQAALGAAWAIVQPLLTMLIFTLFFGRLAQVPTDGIPYPLFCYCALVPWTYFSGVLGQASNSLIVNSNLITKVYFPRALLPASTAVSGLLDFLVGWLMLFGLLAYYRISPTWALLCIPVVILALVAFTISMSLLFSSLNVKFRDVKYVIPFMIQIWLFITPVIYAPSLIPQRYRFLLALNPLWGIVEAFRACVLPTRSIDMRLMFTSAIVIIMAAVLGAIYFRRTERTFADII
jgi:lipopolysaccharide transport system permease protein